MKNEILKKAGELFFKYGVRSVSVDDICIGGESSQPIGNYYVKSPNYVTECEANSIYEIANGDFECGSLAGWTILEGQAFSDDGVNKEKR